MQTPLVDSANLFRLVHFFDVLAAVVFAVSGALVASRKGLDVMGFMWLAVITGVGGDTVRDVILNVPVFSVLLRHEIYVTASVLGACVYAGLNGLGIGRLPAMIAGFLVTFTGRGLAIQFGWSLPVFRESTKGERWKSNREDSAGDWHDGSRHGPR